MKLHYTMFWILMGILAFSAHGLELGSDGKTIVPNPKRFDHDHNFHFSLLYQAEKLSIISSALSSEASIVSEIVAGLEISYAGPWRNSFQDFITYTFLKKDFVQPSRLNLDGSSQLTHELSLGGRMRLIKNIQVDASLVVKQKTIATIGSNFAANLLTPLIYGATTGARFQIYESDKNAIYFRGEGNIWLPKKNEEVDLKLGFGGEVELLYQRRLTKSSTTGFGVNHRMTFQDNSISQIEHIESAVNMFFSQSF